MSSEKDQWRAALNAEWESLKNNETWELVDPPANEKIIGSKWVFAKKIDKDGVRYKARLVAKGFSEIEGVHYNETFSPVVRYSTLRMLLAIAVERGLKISHLDVKTAFLLGNLEETIYMSVAEANTNGKVARLNKAIYGLKQSAKCWYKRFSDEIIKLGFKVHDYEPCVFQRKGIVIALWVDDLFLIYDDEDEFKSLKDMLMNVFEMHDLGQAKTILGINIERTDDMLSMDNESYIKNLLAEFKMENCNPVSTPLETKLKFNPEADKLPSNGSYRKLIGSLMYLTVTTRVDLSYPATYLSQFNENPTTEHWAAAKRVLRYLAGTANMKLCYRKTNRPLIGFSDANWGDLIDGRSFGGYVFMLAGAAISWSCKKQRCVATSSTESEYVQLTEAAKEAIFLKNVLAELDSLSADGPVCIFTDSQSALQLSENPIINSKSKHIQLKEHFIRFAINEGSVRLMYLSTSDMPADFLTKGLSREKHTFCAKAIGLQI